MSFFCPTCKADVINVKVCPVCGFVPEETREEQAATVVKAERDRHEAERLERQRLHELELAALARREVEEAEVARLAEAEDRAEAVRAARRLRNRLRHNALVAEKANLGCASRKRAADRRAAKQERIRGNRASRAPISTFTLSALKPSKRQASLDALMFASVIAVASQRRK